MADTNFVSGTVITKEWLNEVNRTVYDLPSTAPGKGASTIGRGSIVVDSIAGLRALLKTSAATCAFVTGYYAPHDGGGGQYRYDSTDTSTADNSGTVIVASDGGRWKLVHHGSVSVQQFGAKGDFNGSAGTDDTAAIQAALNSRLGEIRFPSGWYRLTGPITWYYTFSDIKGESAKLDFSGISTSGFCIQFGDQAGTKRRKLMQGLEIIGPAATTGAKVFILSSATQDAFTNLDFIQVTFVNFHTQVVFGSNCSNVYFLKCKFTNEDGENWATSIALGTESVMANSGEQLSFAHCQFNNLDTILSNTAGVSGGWNFSQCALVYCRSYISLAAPARVNISQCHIEGQEYGRTWFVAIGNGAIIRIRDSEFWFAGTTVTKEIFFSDSASPYGGIFIKDCLVHTPPTANPAFGVPYLVDQSNQGNVYVDGWRVYDGLPSIPFGRNPGVQVEPWRASQTQFASGWTADIGDASTVAVSSAQVFDGNTTAIQTNAIGQSAKRFRKYRIKSGQMILGSVFAKTTGFAADGTTWVITALMLDESGNQISSGVVYTGSGNLNNFTQIDLRWSPTAPAGVAWVEYYIFSQAQAAVGTRVIYLADMVINPV